MSFVEYVRALTRPIITVIFAAVIAQVVVEKITPPDWFLTLAIGTIGWWFVDRSVQHLKSSKTPPSETPP